MSSTLGDYTSGIKNWVLYPEISPISIREIVINSKKEDFRYFVFGMFSYVILRFINQ